MAVQKTLPRRRFVRPALVAGAGLCMVCAATSGLPAQSTSPEAPTAVQTADLVGTVLDRMSDEPVLGAAVLLIRSDGVRALPQVETDSTGAFGFPEVPVGPYTLAIRRMGYQELTRGVLLQVQVRTEITASLAPEAIDVEPVFVTVERRTSAAMIDFERRRALGIGQFVTRADIERRQPRQVSDLFRMMPGVRVVPDRLGDARLLVHGRCVPKLFIDGVASYEGMSLDIMLRPDDVEGIEVYTTASAPPQYARAACGVVVVWTRVPQRVAGRGDWWKPLSVVGGVIGLLVLIR